MTQEHAIIELQNVAKAYRLRPPASATLPQRVAYSLKHVWRPAFHEVLRDITFRVARGESVALLGVNGSGKTTLLKLICGITRPTGGLIKVRGRAGGLIELTAGFHEDLTGWENIYLNASLLGLSRSETQRRLPAILEFAELGDFIHSPVRHYSWGMLLRLGFAVAVHADLDILVVDEALAVGDGYFQWKCMKKIEEMKSFGTTLLFVSHLPAQADAICERAIWLDAGLIREDGPAAVVAKSYSDYILKRLYGDAPHDLSLDVIALVPRVRIGTGEMVIRSVRLVDGQGRSRHAFKHGEPWQIEFDTEASHELGDVTVIFQVDLPNRPVVKAYSHHQCGPIRVPRGKHRFVLAFPSLRLYEGTYYLTIGLRSADEETRGYDSLIHMVSFSVSVNRGERFSARALDLGAQMELLPIDEEPTPRVSK